MTENVIIVGAGPAGLMLACELGLAGVTPLILEARAEPRADAPGVAINPGTVELLDQRGLMAELRENTIVLPTEHFGFVFIDAQRGRPHENTHLVWQPRLESRLEQRARELGAVFRRDHRVTGLERTAAGVRVDVTGPGGPETLETRYLVGCDGEDSVVRQLAGIGWPQVRRPFHGIIGDVELNFADLAPQHIGVHHLPSGSHVLGAPLEDGVLRVMMAEFGADADEHSPVELDELTEGVERLTGAPLKADRARWLTRYPDRTANAERYSDGPIFLAGGAAHTCFPFNGIGINTAVHDASNLGWKLAAVINGDSPEGLLDTYHQERHPVGAASGELVRAEVAVCHPADTMAPVRAVLERLIGIEAVRDELLASITGTGVRYPAGSPDAHPLVGARLPHVELATTDGPRTVAELLHAGRGVLLDLGETPAPVDLGPAGGRIDQVSARPSPAVPAARVLLRPDGHVAWAGADGVTDGLDAALSTWFGARADSGAATVAS